MTIMIANPPAFFKEFPGRHFINAGSRWSFSMDLPRGHDKNHYQPYPFNLGYLSNQLREKGEDVYAIDACAYDLTDDEFKTYVRDVEPGRLYVEAPTVTFPLTMRLLKEVKEEVKCEIFLFGSHVTARPQDASPFHVIKGGFPPTNINDLPFPDRDGFPMGMYHDFEFHRPAAQLLSSRGCPSSCSFCVQRHVIYRSPKYWRRDATSVVDEMELCRDEHGARQVYFDDDTMTIMPEHLVAVCFEMLNRDVNLPWTCMGDATLKEGDLKIMGDAGCIGIKFGVETVNANTLRKVGKNFLKIEKVKQFVKDCRDLGIWSHATYVIGLPSDRKDDVERTIGFAVELGSDSCQFAIATPFPGTPYFTQCEENGWLVTRDWTRFDGARNAVVSYPWLSNVEIDGLFQEAMRVRKENNLSMRDKVK